MTGPLALLNITLELWFETDKTKLEHIFFLIIMTQIALSGC